MIVFKYGVLLTVGWISSATIVSTIAWSLNRTSSYDNEFYLVKKTDIDSSSTYLTGSLAQATNNNLDSKKYLCLLNIAQDQVLYEESCLLLSIKKNFKNLKQITNTEYKENTKIIKHTSELIDDYYILKVSKNALVKLNEKKREISLINGQTKKIKKKYSNFYVLSKINTSNNVIYSNIATAAITYISQEIINSNSWTKDKKYKCLISGLKVTNLDCKLYAFNTQPKKHLPNAINFSGIKNVSKTDELIDKYFYIVEFNANQANSKLQKGSTISIIDGTDKRGDKKIILLKTKTTFIGDLSNPKKTIFYNI